MDLIAEGLKQKLIPPERDAASPRRREGARPRRRVAHRG